MSDVRKLYVPERYRHKWLCLWEDGHGRIIVNEDRDYLCAESWIPHEESTEDRMRTAAAYYGIHDGQPVWVPGRKITTMEWEVQMERLLDGKIPDEQQEANIALYGEPEEDRPE